MKRIIPMEPKQFMINKIKRAQASWSAPTSTKRAGRKNEE